MNTATEDPRLDRVTPEDNRVDVTPDTSLFPPDRLVEHARHLGASHKVERQPRGRGRGLLARLDAAAERLETVYRALSASPDDGRLPSEDWIRDNFYVVADQVRQVRTDLPTRYYLELPRLAEGPSAGYPRVYALASELIAHSDNRVDVDVLRTFVLAYQETHPLRIGEIWAIPIMLRMALVERLCALADDVLRGRLIGRARRRSSCCWSNRRRPNADGCGGGDRRSSCPSRSRRRLSSSCCAACAIVRPRWRRPGRNCSSRCRRRGAPTR